VRAGIADGEIEEHRRGDDRDPRRTDLEAHAAPSEPCDDSVGGGQSKGAAPREKQSMDLRNEITRSEDAGFPRSGRPAADVDGSDRARGGEQDSATRAADRIRCMADPVAGGEGGHVEILVTSDQ
jgi:hypothetical protein